MHITLVSVNAQANIVDVIQFRSPDYSVYLKIIFSYFCTITYVVGTHKNRLYEMALLSTHNACLN